jgi:hypothetical protein
MLFRLEKWRDDYCLSASLMEGKFVVCGDEKRERERLDTERVDRELV